MKKKSKLAFLLIFSFSYSFIFSQKITLWENHVELNSWAHKIPIEQSKEIVNIGFTGKHVNYTNADTWYPTWASDGNLYSPWTDGKINDESCRSYPGEKAHTGQAKIEGSDPLSLKIISLGTTKDSALPYEGRYPAGSLVYNDIWYYGTYCLLDDPSLSMNWPILGPFVGFRVSNDYGKTWNSSKVSPFNSLFNESTDLTAKPVKIGVPHFVDFGKNMEHSPDGYAYLTCHSARVNDNKPRPGNLSWISGDLIYLIRVKPSPETINDKSQYEFFAGKDENGTETWSKEISDLQPIFEWNNNAGNVSMTYNAHLKSISCVLPMGGPQ